MESSREIETLARQICDRYWLEFRRKNKDQRHLPVEQRMLGRFAPFVRRHNVNLKIYIRWRNYAPTRTGVRASKVFGVEIKPSDGIHYREKQFSALAKMWELNLIIKTEKELRQLRELHEGIHQQLVNLNKAEGKYSWQKQQSSAINVPVGLTPQEQAEAENLIAGEINPLEQM